MPTKKYWHSHDVNIAIHFRVRAVAKIVTLTTRTILVYTKPEVTLTLNNTRDQKS